jgi:hypothetical protein
MRRLIALIVVALLGACVYGLTTNNDAVAVSGTSVSNSTFTNELRVISTTPNLQCYIRALGTQTVTAGAGSTTITSASAAEWANLRIEGLAIAQYVKATFHYTPNAKALAEATTSLEADLTSAATSAQLTCPGTSSAALASMPSEMRTAEIADQANSAYLVSRLNGTIPITLSSLKTYYAQHTAQYNTLCVSIAVVSPANLSAFSAAQKAGATVAELAKKYSSDPSGKTGGAYGCYPPSNASFASVRSDVGSTPLNTFPTGYQVINNNGSEYALFVAPTKSTPTTFANAANAVLADIQSLNASNAKTQEESILFRAAVDVNPAFGQWEYASTGPSVFATSLPKSSNVNDAALLRTASTSTYK